MTTATMVPPICHLFEESWWITAGRHVGRGSGDGVALQSSEIGFQFCTGLAPNLAIFFSSFADDLFEPGSHSRIQANRRDRRAIENRLEDHPGVSSWKGSEPVHIS
jgi:hypothetical protein